MIAQERELFSAPRATSVDPVRVKAAELAVARARELLNLPAFDVVWVCQPGGLKGQMFDGSGRIEVKLNVEALGQAHGHPLAIAREQIFTTLHELQHVADAARLHAMSEEQAEDRANSFAGRVLRQWPSWPEEMTR